MNAQEALHQRSDIAQQALTYAAGDGSALGLYPKAVDLLADEIVRLRGERGVLATLLRESLAVVEIVQQDAESTEEHETFAQLILRTRLALDRLDIEQRTGRPLR